MQKQELTIKYIYEYVLDDETFKISCKKHKVIKETNTTVSLENGQKLKDRSIIDFYKDDLSYCYRRGYESALRSDKRIYTILPISKEVKDSIYSRYAEELKCKIERTEQQIKWAEQDIKRNKDLITENESKLTKYYYELNKLTK